LAPSYDTAGWFTLNAGDMRTTIEALVGLGEVRREPRGCFLQLPGLDADVASAFASAAQRFAPPATPDVREELQRAFARSTDTYCSILALEAWEAHRGWGASSRERYSAPVWQRLNRAQSVTPAQVEAADEHTAELRSRWADFFRSYDFLVLPA